MTSERKKTQVEEMDRGVYDIKNEVRYFSKTEKGLTRDIVMQISKEKNEPDWMLELRLKALEVFEKSKNPNWGPDLSPVDINEITTYIRPDAKMSEDWNELPEDIKGTFDAEILFV